MDKNKCPKTKTKKNFWKKIMWRFFVTILVSIFNMLHMLHYQYNKITLYMVTKLYVAFFGVFLYPKNDDIKNADFIDKKVKKYIITYILENL